MPPDYPPGLVPGIPNEQYHSSEGISSSQLKLMLEAPAKYRASLDGLLPRKDSPAMALGTLLHTLVLEPDDTDSWIIGRTFGRSKADQAAKAAFAEEHAGKLVVTQEVADKAQAMRDSLMSLMDASAILDGAKCEHSTWYTDPDTGLLCKYRPDAWQNWCIADVKSCRDASPDGFSKAIAQFGYHVSAAHYIAGDEIINGTSHRQFVFLCVESEPPYLPAVYVLDDEDLRVGELLRRRALDAIYTCEASGVWPSYNAGVSRHIGVPYWAKKQLLESNEI